MVADMAGRLKVAEAGSSRRTEETSRSSSAALAPQALEKGSNVVTSRILIVDDHDMVRLGLRALIESHSGWTVCGEAVSGREAVQKARELKPDVVIMDLTMPDLNGLEATRQIHRDVPRAEVLVFTVHHSEQLEQAAREAGAQAFVSKTAAGRELTKAIAAMTRHKPLLAEHIKIPAPAGYRKESPQADCTGDPGSPITVREREVLRLLVEGKNSKQIAETLKISTKTVEAHRANMMRKLNLHSVAALVRYAIRNGVVAAQQPDA
jgi:DNA-binding NarL/FixJ family response regulator